MPISTHSTRSLPAGLTGFGRLQEADRVGDSRALYRSFSGVSNCNSGSSRSDRAAGPLAKFANWLHYGSEASRRALDPRTRAEFAMLENTRRAEPVTLQGNAGRLEGYFHHADQGAEHSNTGKVALFLQHPRTRVEKQSLEAVAAYREKGIDVLTVNLRGFGDSEGVPTKQGLDEDARTCFKALLDHGFKAEDIILHDAKFGSSLLAGQRAASRGEAAWGTALDRPMIGSRPKGFMERRVLRVIVPVDHFSRISNSWTASAGVLGDTRGASIDRREAFTPSPLTRTWSAQTGYGEASTDLPFPRIFPKPRAPSAFVPPNAWRRDATEMQQVVVHQADDVSDITSDGIGYDDIRFNSVRLSGRAVDRWDRWSVADEVSTDPGAGDTPANAPRIRSASV